jgi:S-formylglutathione hydrolase FrmB/lysophospholipase L1-like esterase
MLSMKKICWFFLILLILTTGLFAGAEDIVTQTHFSTTLNKEKTFKVYVPKGLKTGERFPVLYILHGAYGSCEDWVSKTRVKDLADNYRMILVFPDGSQFGWYVDSPVEKDMQYETYIAQELPSHIDKLFPTVGTREARGIMGLSMGGHGALLLAAKHPDMYGSASSLSGILKITNHADKWQIAGRLGSLEENRANWEANSVWDQAERFKDAGIRILFDCGVEDTKTGAIGDNRELHEKLKSLGIPHIWREMPGTHSWEYWDQHLEEHLNFHQAAMLNGTPNMERWQKFYFEKVRSFLDENLALSVKPAEKPTICLFGSSSMQGFPGDLLPEYRVFNRGIAADKLGIGSRGLSHRMESSVFDMKPDYVFIKNGRNDLAGRGKSGEPSIERMVQEYEKILTTIKSRMPETKVFIITCAPVRDKYAYLASSTLSYNMELQNLAKKLDVPVVDLHKALVGEDGLLKPEFSKDGLHITRSGYEICVKMMKAAMEKISQKP